MSGNLVTDDDGVVRCWWPGEHVDYIAYHDDEWGRPTTDDTRLFEKICLEGFQAGLSWLTILRKREAFRMAFASFDAATVAEFGPEDVDRLLGNSDIVRHSGKIQSAINNAARALEIADEFGSLATYIWSWEPTSKSQGPVDPIPAHTPESTALSRDLKRRGWTFVGPTTAYAFMQAMGMVNDHLHGCTFHAVVEAEHSALVRPTR